MIKLILTDLDGTFLNSKGSFNQPRFTKVLSALTEKKIAFAAVTGKQTERVEELFGDLASEIWILGDSASRIKHDGHFVFESLIPNQTGLDMIKKLEKAQADQTIIACTPTAAVITDERAAFDGDMVRRSYAKMRVVSDFSEIEEDFVKITVFDRKERCFETFEKIKSEQENFYIVASEKAWIDITSKGVHKGTTVNKLQSILSVTADETMAFGDGYNDFELLEQATESYAMANAFAEVQEKAKHLAPKNDDEGVLQVIESVVL
ncbi:MAG: HAD-IIB family hydrolase [Lactococcus sp.]